MIEDADFMSLEDVFKLEKGKRRRRTTPEELLKLEQVFQENPLPDTAKRRQLALEMNMDARSVQIWFQNRRQKEKARAGIPTQPRGAAAVAAMGKENVPLSISGDPDKLTQSKRKVRQGVSKMSRTSSEPVNSSFLSSAIIRQASSRRSIARTQSMNSATQQEPITSQELLQHMPESSSPVKAFDDPFFRLSRTASLTLDWAASSQSTIFLERQVDMDYAHEPAQTRQQPSKTARSALLAVNGHVRHRKVGANANLSISLGNPSPFTKQTLMVDSPCSLTSFDELCMAAQNFCTGAQAVEAPLSPISSSFDFSDEELTHRAKLRGGDETLSSIGSDAELSSLTNIDAIALDSAMAVDEDQECASLLLGLCAPSSY